MVSSFQSCCSFFIKQICICSRSKHSFLSFSCFVCCQRVVTTDSGHLDTHYNNQITEKRSPSLLIHLMSKEKLTEEKRREEETSKFSINQHNIPTHMHALEALHCFFFFFLSLSFCSAFFYRKRKR